MSVEKRYLLVIYDKDDLDLFADLCNTLELAGVKSRMSDYKYDPRHAGNGAFGANSAVRKAIT